MCEKDILERLLDEGVLIEKPDHRYRTTRKWQSAMARAAFRLMRHPAEAIADDDLRLPILYALDELVGTRATDDELASMAETLLPIEAAELDPRLLPS